MKRRKRRNNFKKEKFRLLCSVFVVNFDYNNQMVKKTEKERKRKKPTIFMIFIRSCKFQVVHSLLLLMVANQTKIIML